MNKECENCIKRKTMWCPTSIDCMALDELPYYLDKISALEKIDKLEQENKQIKENYQFELEENSKLSELWCKNNKILTELEDTLKRRINAYEERQKQGIDLTEVMTIRLASDKDTLDKIQELKEKYK